MTQEDADLWRREQLAFTRKAQEQTRTFVAEQHVLIAEAQRKARILQQLFGLDSSPRYGLPVVAAAFLSVVIAAMAGSVVGLALCRVVAAHCAGMTPA
jgi:hypothetical protein